MRKQLALLAYDFVMMLTLVFGDHVSRATQALAHIAQTDYIYINWVLIALIFAALWHIASLLVAGVYSKAYL